MTHGVMVFSNVKSMTARKSSNGWTYLKCTKINWDQTLQGPAWMTTLNEVRMVLTKCENSGLYIKPWQCPEKKTVVQWLLTRQHRWMEKSINAHCRQTHWYIVPKLNCIWVVPVQQRTLGARLTISLPHSHGRRGGSTKPKPALVKHSTLKEQLSCKAIVIITQPKLLRLFESQVDLHRNTES